MQLTASSVCGPARHTDLESRKLCQKQSGLAAAGCWSQQLSLNACKLGSWCSCRKKKAVHKTTSTDDKRLQNTLKRLGVNTIPGIEEVNIFQGDDVINFTNPKGAACGLLGAGFCADQAMMRYFTRL